ncbi:hypothetical protein T8K17_23640 [Thalassobaculum sp. OXR-137]|uniref:metallophosphoesterase family protein n=1 Tax=Thalassobaculum sp. OXR-137 TaxID=3100173 RepID=UPI002AC92797|nr:hypothetical protein [Thalassobaculum sp. OXR-137]WPZ34212.1 hypothetical protein T8K17_23640 [Thalassobaculum sp. OXR-137]
MTGGPADPIPALEPRGPGHRFVIYGDACAGEPGGRHEATFARVNSVVRRFSPAPEFIVFPGDEIIGLTRDEAALRAQWRHWFEVEMAWLDRDRIPMFHNTANHTTYDPMSERVFAEVMGHLPRNGPPGQEGLSYFIRRGDLLMVFVHTLSGALGGEGHVETDWLDATLAAHADARHKLVVGHHPVFPVNGFEGPFQREIGPPHADTFWAILVRHGVLAYLCSHILAFDVQVHAGVLQVTTAGAGTAHRMPEGVEYLHAVQAALDAEGLRFRVVDDAGSVREALAWPPVLPPAADWPQMAAGAVGETRVAAGPLDASVRAWRIMGRTAPEATAAQTLVEGSSDDDAVPPLWIGLAGPDQRLLVVLGSAPGRSPHTWYGPSLALGGAFHIQIALHGAMGPGGLLWRWDEASPWSSLRGASAQGVERAAPVTRWTLGHTAVSATDRPFLGSELRVWTAHAPQGEI